MFPSKIHAQKTQEPLGSIAEVATFLNVSKITIRRKVNRGELPATRIGNQIRIRWAEVNALLARCTVAPRT
jgi:excisionase family DNA binding protein